MTETVTAAAPASPDVDAAPGPQAEPTRPSMMSRMRSTARGGWERPAFVGLLAATALLYLWALGDSGWANSYYSAAVQAGSQSWKAFFFGSFDAANAITVDKTPMSLWVMALSVRLFGLSSWSILVPQALMGVASVALLHQTVKRVTGSAAAGLLAGAVLALTPVAVLMFRFNNPDALLVLLLVGAAAATVRAVEASDPARRGSAVRWLVLAGALVGFAFLTKMLQAFLVLPALAAAYLLAAHTPLGRRVLHLLAAFGAMVVAGGWWVAIVELWPASSRPYIGGSQNNSVLELTLGYNGFGRLTGEETGSVGGGNGWGQTGILRLIDSDNGGQVGWLLPAAFILLIAALWLTRRRPRTDLLRASLVVWGGWLLVTVVVFSAMAGIFHPYYSIALAPAIGAVVGIGSWVLWQHRSSIGVSLTLAGTVAFSAALAFQILGRTEDYLPWLRWVILIAGLGAAVVLALGVHAERTFTVAAAGTAVVALLLGPAAYAVTTATTPHTGSIPSAGPSGASGMRGGGRPSFGQGTAPNGGQGTAPNFGQGTAPNGGGTGGLLQGSEASEAMVELLQTDAEDFTWAAAMVGANSASGYQLASGLPVMAIGGFNGTDPSPTLAQFQEYVADGQIHFFISGGGGMGGFGGRGGNGPGGSGGSGESSEIAAWVAENFTATTVDGVTVYDLSGGVS